MTISLIASVVPWKDQLAIGARNNTLFGLKGDLKYFSDITTTTGGVVVMGRKTWFSIPSERRPLKNRLNIVLTNDGELLGLRSNPKVCFMTFDGFYTWYKTNAFPKPNVFVIGGGEIYKLFMNHDTLKPETLFITEIRGQIDYADTFMPHPDASYRLVSISNEKTQKAVRYRFLKYTSITAGSQSQEDKYLSLCRRILKTGNERCDRTGVGTRSVFGQQIQFDIRHTVPLLTTKRVVWQNVIKELLWFLRGDTDAKILDAQGVKIWNANTSREALDANGLNHYSEGIIGKGYGWQMRFFGAEYSQAFADTFKCDRSKIGGFDQLAYIVNELKTNPFSRRILMSYWNPLDMDKTALPPCHFSCQFYVHVEHNQRFLDCHFTMRSTDAFLGLPYNLFSYAVLTYILAKKCDMLPGRVVFTGGDVHIYNNHVLQISEQLTRPVRPLPVLVVDDSVKQKDFHQITVQDFDVVGYFPHPPIKAQMAV
jgi:thymidylate synthase